MGKIPRLHGSNQESRGGRGSSAFENINVTELSMGSISPVNSRLPLSSHLTKGCKKISITLLIVILVVSIHHVLGLLRAHTLYQSSYFTVVVDCGSTGTRVNVYEWLRNHKDDQDQPIMLRSFPDHATKKALQHDACQYHCMQTEPGLDKFVLNASGISTALEPLLLWAEHQIPSQRHEETPVFLLATGGLRRLPSKDADWVLENAEAVVKRHKFIYRRSWMRMLSGKEEAYYAWVALNYKMGRLERSLEMPTLGILDMGGSSFQVVMETEKSREDQHFLASKIGSVGHHLIAYSLPAFGLNEAFDRSIIMLSREQRTGEGINGGFELRHPCLNSGFVQNYTCHGCYIKLNATNSQNVSNQLYSNESTLIYLVGDPDWEQCKELARAAAIHPISSDWFQLLEYMDCKAHSSSIETDLQNLTNHRAVAPFHALSGFFAVYSMLNFNPKANMTEIMMNGQQLCSRSWKDLKSTYSTQKYIEQSCFRVPYLVSLIVDGLCLGDAEIIFGPGDVSWTLGAAMVEGEYLWSSEAGAKSWRSIMKNTKIISVTVFLFVIFSCLIFIGFCTQMKSFTALLMRMLGKRGSAVGMSLLSCFYTKRQLN